MAESRVERTRRGFDGVARGDLDLVREMLDPEVQWHGSDGPGSQSCHNGRVVRMVAYETPQAALAATRNG